VDGRFVLSTPVAILAGGLATRLRPVTDTIPKSMVPVGGRPFLEHQLNYLKGQGIRRVVVCAGHLGWQIEEYFRDGAQWGVEIEYSFDGPELLGTAGALRRALPLLGDAFFVMYGDSWLAAPLDEVWEAFEASGAKALMTVFHNRGQWERSNVWYESGRLLAYDKANPRPEMEHIDYGLSVLRREALFGDNGAGDEIDMAELFRKRLPAGFEVRERFYEIGSRAGLHELRTEFRCEFR
jgi:NDP-sugar pyrophosphorylase family protein